MVVSEIPTVSEVNKLYARTQECAGEYDYTRLTGIGHLGAIERLSEANVAFLKAINSRRIALGKQPMTWEEFCEVV